MRRFVGALAGAGALLAGLAHPVLASAAAYHARLLHFEVHIGPGQAKTCDVLGELFTPTGASRTHRVPAILTTNGFGGSYQDQVGLAGFAASRGYAALTYSGLGFGGSGCQITLDDPTYDGAAASQLISFLGGEDGIAFADSAHSHPVHGLDYVIHDPLDHAGHHDRFDPRVGMIGGSYGGEIQFATAAVDPRVDTIIPIITWNNLNYSLAPNNLDLNPASVTSSTPGDAKSTWALLFSGEGVLDGLQGAQADPSRDVGCPNFASWVCPGLVSAGTLGYPDPTTSAGLTHASVASYMSRIRIPTLLMQGENDTLFNLNEAVATYEDLRARHIPVSLVWQSWGHSGSTPAPGELSLDHPDPATQYETARIMAWFGRYLMDQNVSTGPGFAYFRDWINYHGIATPAYATAPAYPVGRDVAFYLSGHQDLVTTPAALTVGSQSFVTAPLGGPAGVAPLDAVGAPSLETDAPALSTSWTSTPLAHNLDVAGEPVLDLQVLAPTASLAGLVAPAGDLVFYAKVYDLAPNGSAALIHGLVAPVRVDPEQLGRPLRVSLPGIVHRFAAGHQIELVLAGGDINYRGGLVAAPLLLTTGNTGQALHLPVVG